MEIHKTILVPEKGDISNVQNYRPISLLCILSKVLESVVYKKKISFLTPLISCNQFGFLKGHSCFSQLLTFLTDIYNSRKYIGAFTLVYVNDISTTINKVSVYLFADDTEIAKKIHDSWDQHELQLTTNASLSWCTNWCMSLHPDKCVAMRFALSNRGDLEHHLNGFIIKSVYTHRDLGIIISNDLTPLSSSA